MICQLKFCKIKFQKAKYFINKIHLFNLNNRPFFIIALYLTLFYLAIDHIYYFFDIIDIILISI